MRTTIVAFVFFFASATCAMAGAGSQSPRPHVLRESDLEPIGDIVPAQIAAGRIPGAVVVIGQGDGVVYRHAFGYRELAPQRIAMTPDTIFDLASLTKPIATSIALMQLHERGKLDLDAPVARYWPGFATNGKEPITVRELMTHYSGLAADLDLAGKWTGYGTALEMIEAARPLYPPGTHYAYSDINFEALGEVVRRVSGVPLDAYCAAHIFLPLGMTDTGFRPPASERDRIAPTLLVDGHLRLGDVHDPTAARMGGVSGHAGLFSTADDLAVFAQMLLNGGRWRGVRILTSRSIDEMTIPESPTGAIRLRGLGWDVAAPFAATREQMLSVGSYGHTGFTGTMLWIDPVSNTFVVILTNRTYPNGNGDAGPLRKEILALVSERMPPLTEARVLADRPALGATYAFAKAREFQANEVRVATGADMLVSDGFAPLRGARVGLITNETGATQAGVRDIDAFSRASTITLAAIFSPEHGLYGLADESVASGMEPTTGLPLFSLYGDTKRPSDAMLAGLDALVFDVQDSGARFYTYVTTMAYAMEAAARHGIDFYVLDRPDPISAGVVQGPVMDANLKSFTGYFPLPTRPGMTVGELAEMFNHENGIGARLHVIRMRGYQRQSWYDQTDLRWIAPSPNLRTLDEAALYPGVGMLEGANVSVGRGTEIPFEVIGAPWIERDKLLTYLNARRIAGVRFETTGFTPSADRFAHQPCQGIKIDVEDRRTLDSPELGVELATALYRLYPRKFRMDSTLGMVGSLRVLDQIKAGEDPKSIEQDWQARLADFRMLRSKYLLY
jgi:uncharacterized protein YbbC (DUF1343 family)/CubicO group peptidase (beta-lactamase class C family)